MGTLLLIAQFGLGIYFVRAGLMHYIHVSGMTGYAASKNIPMPKISVMATGSMLILGGLGIFFGVCVQVALWLLIIFLIAAAFLMHTFWKETDPAGKSREEINFTKNLALAAALILLLGQVGSWPWSIM